MSAHRNQYSEVEKEQATKQAQARMAAHRNQQSEEEKDQATEQAQARMAALRGNQTPAEQKEATSLNSKARATLRENLSADKKEEAATANSSRKRLQRELFSPEQKQSKGDLASSIKPFHGFERDIHIALELFYAMGKAADPKDAEAILEPISNDETRQMIEAFRNVMSPNCTIIGCAACGRRLVLDHMKPIPDHLKVPIHQLSMLKVSEAALTKINFNYIKFYDIVSVNTKPRTTIYIEGTWRIRPVKQILYRFKVAQSYVKTVKISVHYVRVHRSAVLLMAGIWVSICVHYFRD
jgi:flagellar motor protein MotB